MTTKYKVPVKLHLMQEKIAVQVIKIVRDVEEHLVYKVHQRNLLILRFIRKKMANGQYRIHTIKLSHVLRSLSMQ